MFRLNRNGLLCKIVYGWGEQAIPLRTNLCGFFWRVVLSLLIVWPFVIVTRAIGWIVRIVGAPIAFICFGYRPAGPSWRFFNEGPDHTIVPFVPISWWPKWNDSHIMPILVIGVPLGLVVVVYAVGWLFWTFLIQEFFVGVVFASTLGTTIFWVVVGLIVAFVGYCVVSDTEGWEMTKTYLKARTKRVCPIIEIR